jgi:hypothetical protein
MFFLPEPRKLTLFVSGLSGNFWGGQLPRKVLGFSICIKSIISRSFSLKWKQLKYRAKIQFLHIFLNISLLLAKL